MLVALAIAGAIVVFAAGSATGRALWPIDDLVERGIREVATGSPRGIVNPAAADHELDGPSREGIA